MDSAQKSFGTFLGDLSQTEKLSEIKLPLKVISVPKISYIKIDRNDNQKTIIGLRLSVVIFELNRTI